MQLLPKLTIAPAPAATSQACAEALLDALPPVMRVVRKHMRSHRSRALSLPQFRTLALLRAVRSANLSAVAEFLGASLPTTSRIVSGLVAKGFVTRREHADDRRQVELALTARGTAVIEDARRATRDRLAKELDLLTDADRRGLLRAMETLYDVFAASFRGGDDDPHQSRGALAGAAQRVG